MKSTGKTRKIDPLGRVTIPKDVCKEVGLEIGDTLEVFTEGNRVIYQKYQSKEVCSLCGNIPTDGKFEKQTSTGKIVCHDCLKEIVE